MKGITHCESLVGRERYGDVWVLTFNRPDRRNALTPEMLNDLHREISMADGRAFLLRGEGKVFCSGFDLSLCHQSADGSVMRSLLQGLSECIAALRALPIPVVIAAHGGAIAGGCALLGGCDFAVTDAGAQLGYPVVRLGISPAVSAPFLKHSLTLGHARERMLDSGLISGVEAERIGLASDCRTTAEEVFPRALEVAEMLASKPPGAMAATRRWLAEIEERGARVMREEALEVSLSRAGTAEEAGRLASLFTKL